MSWARACFQWVVVRPWMRRVGVVRLLGGLPAFVRRWAARLSSMLQIPSHRSLTAASSLGKCPQFFGDFTQLVVQRFDSVGGVYDAAQHGRERQEGREALPGALPGGNGLGVARSQVAGREVLERPSGGFLIGRAVHGLEGRGDALAVLVGHETHGRAD